MFPSGQPWWQNGTPQSMQRDAWTLSLSSGNSSYTSFQSWIRSSIGRRSKPTLPISRKPFRLPMLYHCERLCRLLLLLFQHSSIVERHDLGEPVPVVSPVVQNSLCTCALRQLQMPGDQPTDESFLFRVC